MEKPHNRQDRQPLHSPRRLSAASFLLTIALSSLATCDYATNSNADTTSSSESLSQNSPPTSAKPPPGTTAWTTSATSAATISTSTTATATGNQLARSQDSQMMTKTQPSCMLGNDTYQLGERWNPNLPPFGVQVCVQCECIVRQRKNCYEAKVTCRRITNECPIIDSCPDGKGPVTTAGQCCKSCQSTNPEQPPPTLSDVVLGRPSPVYQAYEQQQQQQHHPDRLLEYKNERIKEYQSVIKNLEACEKRDATDKQPIQSQPPVKSHKSNKNDLNGIDSKLAFKSLRDSQNNYLTVNSKNRDSSRSEPKPVDDSLQHQHPNDVQSSSSSSSNHHSPVNQDNNGSNHNSNNNYSPRTTASQQPASTTTRPPVQPANACLLGSEIYQMGANWHPILPPHGEQVCVQCNCIATLKPRKACYEPKVTCRRISSECPNIELCPDGKKPVTISGQCCKSCPGNGEQTTPVIKIARAIREHQVITKNYPPCQKQRDVDLTKQATTSSASSTISTTTTATRVKQRS